MVVVLQVPALGHRAVKLSKGRRRSRPGTSADPQRAGPFPPDKNRLCQVEGHPWRCRFFTTFTAGPTHA